MHIAVLGLGRMGRAVAARLLDREYEVTVWNRSSGKAVELVARGARAARDIPQAVQQAEVVVTLLADDDAVKEVCLGDGGVIASLSAEAILVDMSTVSPGTSRALEEAAPQDRSVTAPIQGSPTATASGQARLLISGPEGVVQQLETLWNDLSAGRVYCGAIPRASMMKILSNQLLIAGTALMAEAMVTAQAAGIDNDFLRQFFGQSPVLSPGQKLRLDDVLDGDHAPQFTVKLADKDLHLALQMAARAGVELPTTTAAEQVLTRAIEMGYGEQDMAAVVEVVRPQRATAGTP